MVPRPPAFGGVQGQSPWLAFARTTPRMIQARDELQDDHGRLRREWRRMLGNLLGMGVSALQARSGELNRALAEEGAAAVMGAARWRCDPVPFLLTEAEFGFLARGLAQRADLLEAVLRDVYGPLDLLRSGLLPPAALVYPSPYYLRPCRNVPGARHLHLYAADLMRAPDGRWHVLADHTAEPAGLAHVLENRRMMARVLPDMFRSIEVAQIRPFFDAWQDALQRLAPQGRGSPGLALLSPGHSDRRWFEHVVLARELGCTLVEDGDLTVRSGCCLGEDAARLKSGPCDAAVSEWKRRLDPLELHEDASGGVPGLFGGHACGNGAGAEFARGRICGGTGSRAAAARVEPFIA